MTVGTSAAVIGCAAHLARPPSVATWSTSWKASRPRNSRLTCPTSANIGVESWRAVWIPIARLDAPTALVPRQTAGRPVSCPYASAMKAAPPSCRVAITRMPASSRASSTPRNDSPGTVNAIRTPAARRLSAMARPTVRGPAGAAGSSSVVGASAPRRASSVVASAAGRARARPAPRPRVARRGARGRPRLLGRGRASAIPGTRGDRRPSAHAGGSVARSRGPARPRMGPGSASGSSITRAPQR